MDRVKRMFGKHVRWSLPLLGFWLFSAAVWAGGDPDVGKRLTSACVACHNEDGNASLPEWPKIAGQHEAYLYQQLIYFRQGASGPRHNPVMLGIVGDMTDQNFKDLAAFYATQTMSVGTTPENYAELGEQIYKGGRLETGVSACIACHGPAGEGNMLANFPRVGGQMAEYTINQLKMFQNGARRTDMNGIMRLIAARMSDEEIEAVSHYMAGLHVASGEGN